MKKRKRMSIYSLEREEMMKKKKKRNEDDAKAFERSERVSEKNERMKK